MRNTKYYKSGIYSITNIVNNKLYIGSTYNFEDRWYKHRKDLNLGKHCNKHLQCSWNKYGEANFKFSIIEEIDSNIEDFKSLLISREEYYIQKYDSITNGYNIREYCDSNLGIKWSEESKKNLSEYRKTHIVKEAVTALNKYASSRKGIANDYASNWYNKLSEQERQIFTSKRLEAVREAHRIKLVEEGFIMSPESIKKSIETKKERGLIRSISLYQLNGKLYKVYESYSDCLRDFNESVKNSSCLLNCIKSNKLFYNYIVSTCIENTLSNYEQLVPLINSNKSNLKYARISTDSKEILYCSTKTELALLAQLAKPNKKLDSVLQDGSLYKGYYWKCIEPIIREDNSKEGELRESPEVDNFEPSISLND